jgi:hypothetical protein
MINANFYLDLLFCGNLVVILNFQLFVNDDLHYLLSMICGDGGPHQCPLLVTDVQLPIVKLVYGFPGNFICVSCENSDVFAYMHIFCQPYICTCIWKMQVYLSTLYFN